mgnify:CR=1 FL=1
MKLSLNYCRTISFLFSRLEREKQIAKIGYFLTSDFQSTIARESWTGKVFYFQSTPDQLKNDYQKITTKLPQTKEVLSINDIPSPTSNTQKYFIYVICGKPLRTAPPEKKINTTKQRLEKIEMQQWINEKKEFLHSQATSVCYL